MNRWIKHIITIVCLMFTMTNIVHVNASTTNAKVENNQDETVIVTDSLVITVSYGFNQEARYGRLAMMQVDVYNKGEAFEGVITAVLVNENQDNIAYSIEGSFVGGAKSEFHLLLPMNRASQDLVFTIEDDQKKTIVEELIPLKVTNLGDYCYVGILSEMSMQLSYFEYFGNKVVNLDKDNLPSDYLAYDMLDIIVVDEFELDRLEPTQLEALFQWTRQGGSLVLGIDVNYMQNVELLQQYNIIQINQEINYEASEGNVHPVSLIEDQENIKQLTKIKNYEAARSQILKDIEDSKIAGTYGPREVYVGADMLNGQIISDLELTKVSKKLSIFSVEDSKASIYHDGGYLFEAVTLGEGVVLLFHFGLGNPEVTKEALDLNGNSGGALLNLFYSSIVVTVLEQRSEHSIERNSTEIYSNNQDYRINNIGRYPEIDQVPQVLGYVVVLVLYLLLIGPVLFFVLWKRKKQMRVWIYVPMLTLLFLVIMFGMGSSTRIKEAYAGFMNIEYYDSSMNQVEGKTFASVVLTNKNANNLTINTADMLIADAREYPTYYSPLYQETKDTQQFYDYGKPATKITNTKNGIELKFYNRPAFSGELFEATYYQPYEEIIKGEIVIRENSISGELTNQSKVDFERAILWVNGYYVNIGTMNTGSTIDILDRQGAYASHIESLMYTENPVSIARGFVANQSLTSSQSREIDTLSYIFSHYFKDSQSAYLIAFTNQVPTSSPFAEITKSKASFGVSAVVTKVALRTQDEGKIMVTNMDRYMDSDNEYAWDQETISIYEYH